MAVVGGCHKKPEHSGGSSADGNKSQRTEPNVIGPQFWKYDLSEYERVDQDVFSGLGGRWISVRYRLKEGRAVSRDQMISRITQALETDGWKREPLPNRQYAFPTIWETSPQDLYFTRKARETEPEHWFFSQVIHVGSDGQILCAYCEVGW
ncbi:MAG: hypothetical protein JW828_11775 [Sedimentisphaerales bacterium]|nr:hypothetical protein [Sedimentisphaerales bacterium]